MNHFRWTVHDCGYAFVNPTDETYQSDVEKFEGGPLLKPKSAKGKSKEITYSPLTTHTCLFQRFARTRLSYDSVAAFADEFGPLGMRDAKGRLTVELGGEPFGFWEDSIMDMRWAIALWLAYLQERPGKIPLWIGENNFLDFALDRKRDYLPLDPYTHSEEQDILITKRINSVPPIVDLSVDNPVLAHLKPLMEKYLKHVSLTMYSDTSSGTEKLKRTYFPFNLLGAIWLQFSDAVSEDKGFRKCHMCDNWFEITKSRGQKKKHCSNACRVKLYRESKKEVIT